MSESGEIVRRLVAAGANYESIGQAVGRNRSLIRQVGIGRKPGNNLADALAGLERRLAGVERVQVNQAARTATEAAPRRTTTRGALARVRKPTTITGRSWTASTVKKAAARSGARGLGHPIADAAEDGRQLAVTVSVSNHLAVESYGKSKRGQAGAGGSIDFLLGDAGEVWDSIREDYDGNVTAYVAAAMVEAGHVSAVSGGMDNAGLIEHAAANIVEIDLRTFDG